MLRASADSLRGAIERDETPGRDPVTLAGVLASLGRTDDALGGLERLAEQGRLTDENLLYGTWLSWHPLFDSLRSKARFQEVLQRVRENQEHHRQQILQTDLDLYPPGVEPDTAGEAGAGKR